MKKYVFVSLILFSVAIEAIGQNKNCKSTCSCFIQGHVVDAKTNEPIAYASVQINDTQKGAMTDETGLFKIEKVCDPEADITISHIGYKTLTHHHDSHHESLVVQLAPDDLILESIVVESEKGDTDLSSVSANTLEAKDLELYKSDNLGDMLTNITGVSTVKTGSNIVKPVIHGLYGNRILIINNGLRHESQNWGDDHAPEIDASNIDNITLVKGASAIKYGPDAMGGVIILNPPKMELLTNHLHGEAEAGFASNGQAINTNLLLQKGYKNWAWMVQGSNLYQGDLKAPDYQLTNTGARETSFLGGARYHKNKLDLELHVSHVEQNLGVLRGSVTGNLEDLDQAMSAETPAYTSDFSYDINNPQQKVSHDMVSIASTYNFQHSQLNIKYGFQKNKRREFDVRKSANNQLPSIDLELTTQTLDIDWLHPTVKGWEGKIGAQWLYQDNNNIPGTNTVQFVPNYNNSRIGLFFVESKSFGKYNIEFGARQDYQSTSARGRNASNKIYMQDLTYNSTTAMLGINRNLSKHSHIQTSIGTAWRPPNVAELYSYGKHEFTIKYGYWRYYIDDNGSPTTGSGAVFNQDTKSIENEKSYNWTTTFNSTLNSNSLEVTAFVNYLTNYIYSKPGGLTLSQRGAFPFFIYDQTDAIFTGLDISYIKTHSQSFKSQIKGSYLHAEDVDNNDYFVGIPANQASYKLSYNHPILGLQNFEANIEGIYHFKQYNAPRAISPTELRASYDNDTPILINDDSNFDFMEAPDGYFLLNINATATIKKFLIGLQVRNALNNSYRDYSNSLRYFSNEPGINFKISAKYKF